MKIDVKPVSWASHGDVLAEIRHAVFVNEQGVPEALEWDGEDPYARHWLALADQTPAGTVRLLSDGHIGRVAVRQPWRHRGVGSHLMQAVIQHARTDRQREVYLHAQTDALAFYERLGFRAEGPVFDDAGIPHRTMRLNLESRELGRHGGRFAVADRAAAVRDLAQQAHRQLRLFSNELEPALYDNPAFVEALSRLARHHRGTEARLLILNGRAVSQRGHRLLELHRRLPSSVAIRRLALPEAEVRENYLIADNCGVLCYDVREPARAWADYNNVPVAENYRSQFDDWWHRSKDDPELRILAL